MGNANVDDFDGAGNGRMILKLAALTGAFIWAVATIVAAAAGLALVPVFALYAGALAVRRCMEQAFK